MALLLALAMPGAAGAATTFRLPAAACDPEALLGAGFEDADVPPTLPSEGAGGAPGDYQRSAFYPHPEFGNQLRTYYLHVPPGYDPDRPAPLVVVLHGAAGSALAANTQAAALRTAWAPAADAIGALVAAPVAGGNSGGWLLDVDEAAIAGVLADVAASHRIDTTRVHLFGFSAGAHFAWRIALRDTARWAGLGIAAGVLRAATCDSTLDPVAPGCAELLAGLPRRPSVRIRVGDADPLRAEIDADLIRLRAAGFVDGTDLDAAVFAGGHTVPPAELPGWAQAFCRIGVAP